MNAVAWFLSDCLFFYFAFPYILKFMRKLTKTVSIIVTMLLIWAAQIAISYFSYQINIPTAISGDFGKWMTYICPLYRLGDFCIGGMLGLFYIKYKQKVNVNKRKRQMLSSSIEIAAILVLFFTLMVNSGEIKVLSWKWFKYPKWLPASLLLVWAFAANDGVITRSLQSNWLIKIGNLSAYAFLIHQVTINYVEKSYNYIFGTQILPIVKVSVSLIVTLFLSYAYLRTRQNREKLT